MSDWVTYKVQGLMYIDLVDDEPETEIIANLIVAADKELHSLREQVEELNHWHLERNTIIRKITDENQQLKDQLSKYREVEYCCRELLVFDRHAKPRNIDAIYARLAEALSQLKDEDNEG